MLRSILLSVALVFAFAPPVGAAEIADVIDADDGDDLFDFVGGVFYRRSLRRAKITREYNCTGANNAGQRRRSQDAQTCANAPPHGELLQVKELRYQEVRHEVIPRARFGLWHDLELMIEAPIVVQSEQELRFAGDGGDPDSVAITPENSSIAPGVRNDGVDPENLFEVPGALPTRAGFGDLLVMVRYSPVAYERSGLRAGHEELPSDFTRLRGDWTLELGWRIPTGEVKAFGNEGVGRGVHELVLGTAFSRRFNFVDPYTSLHGIAVIPSDDSLFKDYGDAQDHVGPGHRLEFEMGAEIVPYQDNKKGMKVLIDLGVGAVWRGEGRDYNELFDALASGGESCKPEGPDGAKNCARYNPDSRSVLSGDGNTGVPHDGITTVEQYMTFRAHLGLGLHVRKYVRFALEAGIAHDTEHFLSGADIGRDLDGTGLVEPRDNPRFHGNGEEHNPTYVKAIDEVGRRLRVEETTVFDVIASLQLSF